MYVVIIMAMVPSVQRWWSDMNIKNIVLMSIVALVILGCAEVGYKKYGDGGYGSAVGYSDFEISHNHYRVSYIGTPYDSQALVMEYAYRRGKDICKALTYNEYRFYDGEGSWQKSSSMTTYSGGMAFTDTKGRHSYSVSVECLDSSEKSIVK